MRCKRCHGSGRIMGNGMIYGNCNCDNGQEICEVPSIGMESKPVQIDKRSKAYREAITRLMKNGDLNREEATKIFESEFDKIA